MRVYFCIILAAFALASGTLSATHAADGSHTAAHRLAQQFAVADEPKPERPSLDYEMEMLRRARLEETERKKRSAIDAMKIEAEPRSAEPDTIKVPSPPVVSVTKRATAKELRTRPGNGIKAVSTDRKVQALSNDKGLPVVRSRDVALATKVTTQPKPAAPKILKKREPSTYSAPVERVAIMIVFSDEKRQRDPVICATKKCFIAQGLEEPALEIKRRRALSLRTSREVSDDPCWKKTGCVFRNVPVGQNDLFQVFDLIEAKRDATRQDYAIDPDGTCGIQDGQLGCGAPLQTSEFRMWVVPEFLAERAGGLAIENAVAYGLPLGAIKPIYVDK